MPLADLELYGSGSTTSSSSAESDVDANRPQGKADCNATEEESGDDRSEAQKFDEQRENSSDEDNSSEHTPAQKSKRLPFTQRSQEHSVAVPESDAEELAEGTDDETLASRVSKSAIRRPRLDWEHVSTWNRQQVAPDDYEGEIARIFAKSLHDAKYAVMPRYNSRAISEFRYKTVSLFQFVSKIIQDDIF